MVSRSLPRVVITATIVLSYVCSRRFGEVWAMGPIILLCAVAWWVHLPPARRTAKSLFRYLCLVGAHLAWAVLLGWLLDHGVVWMFGSRFAVPFAFVMPFVIPVLHIFLPGVGAFFFHLLLDLPFMAIVSWNHFVWGEKLNSLATAVADDILLGSLPFSGDVATLRSLGVTHVINMCREWTGPTAQYAEAGIVQLRLPTTDGLCPTSTKLLRGVDWVRAERAATAEKFKVFVHCRFGMGRSASMVLVQMVADGMEPKKAMAHIKHVRPEAASVLGFHGVRDAIKALQSGATRE